MHLCSLSIKKHLKQHAPIDHEGSFSKCEVYVYYVSNSQSIKKLQSKTEIMELGTDFDKTLLLSEDIRVIVQLK